MIAMFRIRGLLLCALFFMFATQACSSTSPSPVVTPNAPTDAVAQVPMRSPIARAPSAPSVFAFSATLNGRGDIYLTDTSGKAAQALITGQEGGSCPAFSPDRRRLAFCARKNGKNGLYIASADGSNPLPWAEGLGDCGCNSDAPLSWSPDGKWISLPVTSAEKNQPIFDVFAVSTDDAQVVKLTSSPQRYGGLLWTPDSQALLISGQVDGKADIYRFQINTQKARLLCETPLIGAPTSWSPDGSKLLLYADSGDGNFDIFLLPAGAQTPTRLTNAAGFDSYPQWFPDGQSILFVSTRSGDHEIFRMNADGSDQRNLTNNPGTMDAWPSLSPDGQKIIYLTSTNNQWDSWMMDADGSNRIKITDRIGIPSKITWKP